MAFGTKPIELFQIDMDQCALTYGQAPCTAVLGTTGERKCFNSFKTCQDTANFTRASETGMTADHTYEGGDTVDYTDIARDADAIIAVDVVFAASPSGCIFELGGAATGAYIGVTSGSLVFRAYDASVATGAGVAKVTTSVTPYAGGRFTLYLMIDHSEERIEAWARDSRGLYVRIGTDASTSGGDWAGTSNGGVGVAAGGSPVGEDATAFNGTVSEARVYEGVAALTGKQVKTLTYCPNITGIPKMPGIYPALQSISTNPEEINLSGASPRSTALGKRARVNVSMLDFVDDDDWTDPYRAERVSGAAQADSVGYDTSRGTHFAKLMARNPYYLGRPARVLRGYVGQALSDMTTENYVLSEWNGPNAGGAVKVTAKDVFDLVEGEKVLAPSPSRGKLLIGIDDDDLSFTVTPAGIGDIDYPASGLLRIGQELMRFTRSGDDFTITQRGVEGTEVLEHSELDVVQICLEYANQRLVDIANDLLTVQGPIDAALFDVDAARAEEDSWLGGTVFSGIVAEPTSIAVLIGELLQHGAAMWWSSREQAIKFRVNRPLEPGETARTINTASNILEDGHDIDHDEEQRVSTVNLWHAIIDPTESPDASRNFAKLSSNIDPSSASVNEHGQARIHTIYSRWLGRTGDDAFASVIGERLVARYRDVPTIITAILDVQDADIKPGDLINVTTYLKQDVTGLNAPKQFQVTKVERVGERVKIRAESSALDGRYGFYMTEPQADYSTATDAEKATGAFYFDENETSFSDGTGPYVYF